MFSTPLRPAFCVDTSGGGVVYLSATVSADTDSVCHGRKMLSEQEFNALRLAPRCQLRSSSSVPGAREGYFVSVYSDSNPTNVRAAEMLCE